MAKNDEAVKRFNLSFTRSNRNGCDASIFDFIELVKMSHRTDLYHNAFRSGILLAMIDDRLPVILATLASKDDPKQAFLSALASVGMDIAWDKDLKPAGYRKRTLLSEDQRLVIPNEDGFTFWTPATKEEFTAFVAGEMPEGTQVEALFSKSAGNVSAAPPKKITAEKPKPVALPPEPPIADDQHAKARNMMCS